jgi:hypothetical protein
MGPYSQGSYVLFFCSSRVFPLVKMDLGDSDVVGASDVEELEELSKRKEVLEASQKINGLPAQQF